MIIYGPRRYGFQRVYEPRMDRTRLIFAFGRYAIRLR